MKRKHTWSLVILGALTATLFAEGFLRLIEVTPFAWKILPIAEVSLYGPDPETGYTLRTNISGTWITENRARVHTNNLGLRDKPLTLAKPNGQQRVALLGDSLAEALQVDLNDTYQTLAEKLLDPKSQKVEIVNLGLAGATAAVQMARAKSRGLALQPDAFLFMNNFSDFSAGLEDDSRFPAYVIQTDGIATLQYGFRESRDFKLRTSRLGQLIYWLIDHSKIATLINNRKNQSDLGAINLQTATKQSCESWPSSSTNLNFLPEKGAAQLRAFIKDLSQLQHTAGRIPVILALANLPGCTTTDRANLATSIRNYFKESNVTIIDFDGTLERTLAQYPELEKKDIYGFGMRRGTGHLNEIGHKIYAEAVANILHPYLAK